MHSNILNFLSEDGIILTRKTNDEYAGACPFCAAGKDRFIVWPRTKPSGGETGGRYWCRYCGRKGDLIQYLREKRGMTFKEACQTIGREPNRRKAANTRTPQKDWHPIEVQRISEAWSARAKEMSGEAVSRIWQEGPCLSFLKKRGFNDQTIKAGGLGWNSKDIYDDRSLWGLEPEKKPDGKQKRIWIPKGLVIPYADEEQVIRLRIRRFSDDEPRYVIVSGSDTRPMVAGNDTGIIIIVESELDALFLSQEAGDWALIVALGSVAKQPDKGLHAILMKSKIILNALDYDHAGAKEAWGFWVKTYGTAKVKRWPVPMGKDPGEAYQSGVDLRVWIEAGLDVIL